MKSQLEKLLDFYSKRLESDIGKTIEREKQKKINLLLKKKRLSVKQIEELEKLSNPFDNNKDVIKMISSFIKTNKNTDEKYYKYIPSACSVEQGIYDVLVLNEEAEELQNTLACYNGKNFVLINYEQKEWVSNGVDISDVSTEILSNVKYFRKYRQPDW